MTGPRTVVGFDHSGSRLLEPGGQAVFPHPWMLEQMVIDRDQSDVITKHDISIPRPLRRLAPTPSTTPKPPDSSRRDPSAVRLLGDKHQAKCRLAQADPCAEGSK